MPKGTEAANGATLAEAVSWSFTHADPDRHRFVGRHREHAADTGVRRRVRPARRRRSGAGGHHPRRGRQAVARSAGDRRRDRRRHRLPRVPSDRPRLTRRRVPARSPSCPADTELKIDDRPQHPVGRGAAHGLVRCRYVSGTHVRPAEGHRHVVRLGRRLHAGRAAHDPVQQPTRPEAFSADQVSVSPAIPGLRIDVYGGVIDLPGPQPAAPTYTVTLDGDLTDVFGQTLGDDVSIEFESDRHRPSCVVSTGNGSRPTPPPTSRSCPSRASTTTRSTSMAWAVTPANLDEYRDYLEDQWSNADEPAPEWQVVYDEVIEIDAAADQWIETAIDLSSPFNQTGSQLVVRVEPTRVFSENDDDYWRNRPTIAWVQKTTLAVDAFFDDQNLLIWTTDLTTGKPVGGVPVELLGDGRIATTDEEGLAELELGTEGILGLWANGGDRTAFLPSDWWEGWKASDISDESRWYIFDDRGIYRPGETARVTGWVRRFARTEDAQLALFGGEVTVTYQAWDPQGNQIGTGTVDLNALGGFNISDRRTGGFQPRPGLDRLPTQRRRLQLRTAAVTHTFQVQEFRTPEFEVTARNESAGPHYTARPATVAVDADYYSGGPLPDAEVNWLVSTSDDHLQPPELGRVHVRDLAAVVVRRLLGVRGLVRRRRRRTTASTAVPAMARHRVRAVHRPHRRQRHALPPDRLRRTRCRPADLGHGRSHRVRREPPGVGIEHVTARALGRVLRRIAKRPHVRRARAAAADRRRRHRRRRCSSCRAVRSTSWPGVSNGCSPTAPGPSRSPTRPPARSRRPTTPPTSRCAASSPPKSVARIGSRR